MKMKGIINVGGAAIIAAVLATPATAQEVGTYKGTSADGQSLTFVVGTDPNTGYPALTSAGLSFSAPCKNSTVVLTTAWGFGLMQDIIDRKTGQFSQTDSYFTFDLKLDFAADGQTATGTIRTYSPTLDPVGSKPTKALLCESPMQALSLTLQSSETSDSPVKQSSHYVGPTGNTHQ
jgi:hypothetical protein